ncbi:MAG: hypothetical protein LKJ92_05405 [Ruminococcus sp.]|nr:hypothetical protein [Ruminococcus sp.]
MCILRSQIFRQVVKINRSNANALRGFFGQADSKLKSKIEQKKLAHELRTDKTVNQNEIENYEEQGFTMSIFSKLQSA